MNRKVTNAIRYVMDEILPPVIRDNRYFMYPFFYIWFKGKNIRQIMDFKSLVYNMSEEEFSEFYRKRDSLAKDRPTDLSQVSIDYMLDHLVDGAQSLLDVGCGNGYFLEQASAKVSKTCGCDVLKEVKMDHSDYVQGNIEALPFEDNAFDIVSCHHTLEHVINLDQSIAEIKRVARKQVLVVVPCQRYFYYTLDEHIHFFPIKEMLEHRMGMKKFHCQNINGDLVYLGYKD